MLVELSVANLGVIGELSLVFASGMTALTGETGAGKTLIVEAIELLVGERADTALVREGAEETVVEGRFVHAGEETVLRRVVPVGGRSRAYVNGRMATIGELAQWGRLLLDLHGQHAHQSLLSKSVQRSALDKFGHIDLDPLKRARGKLTELRAQLADFGGTDQGRARELDLLRYQLSELTSAALSDPDEDRLLEVEEGVLGDAVAHREAGRRAFETLGVDGGARDHIATAIAELGDRPPFVELSQQLNSLAAELDDLCADLRLLWESIEDDPNRLEEVRQRRKLLHDLRRKYGPTIAGVIEFREELLERISKLENLEGEIERLEGEIEAASAHLAEVELNVGNARRDAAPKLSRAVAENLAELALGNAEISIEIGDGPGDDVTYLLSTNPGSSPLPLAKVASGGELARAMLALRLVLNEAPNTLIFDEVDAGIGGTAAVAVGRSLARLGSEHQVLVVTHLPQVAAAADNQVVISKVVSGNETFTVAEPVVGDARAVEIARMLSGSPDSEAALEHAKELLCRS